MISTACYDGALMIHNLPTLNRAAPNRRPAGNPFTLNQGVSDQIIVSSNLKTMKVSDLPDVLCRVFVSRSEGIQNECPAESTARGADLPKFNRGHLLEIFACRPES